MPSEANKQTVLGLSWSGLLLFLLLLATAAAVKL